MEILCVEIRGCDQETPGLLEDAPDRLQVQSAVFLALVQVQAEGRTKTHGANDGVVGAAVLVWHDAGVWGVFVDQDMVWSLVRAVMKDVLGLAVG